METFEIDHHIRSIRHYLLQPVPNLRVKGGLVLGTYSYLHAHFEYDGMVRLFNAIQLREYLRSVAEDKTTPKKQQDYIKLELAMLQDF